MHKHINHPLLCFVSIHPSLYPSIHVCLSSSIHPSTLLFPLSLSIMVYSHPHIPSSIHSCIHSSAPPFLHPPSIIHVFLHLFMYLSIPFIHSCHYLPQSTMDFEQSEDVMQNDPVGLYFNYRDSWEDLQSPQLEIFFDTHLRAGSGVCYWGWGSLIKMQGQISHLIGQVKTLSASNRAVYINEWRQPLKAQSIVHFAWRTSPNPGDLQRHNHVSVSHSNYNKYAPSQWLKIMWFVPLGVWTSVS